MVLYPNKFYFDNILFFMRAAGGNPASAPYLFKGIVYELACGADERNYKGFSRCGGQ